MQRWKYYIFLCRPTMVHGTWAPRFKTSDIEMIPGTGVHSWPPSNTTWLAILFFNWCSWINWTHKGFYSSNFPVTLAVYLPPHREGNIVLDDFSRHKHDPWHWREHNPTAFCFCLSIPQRNPPWTFNDQLGLKADCTN